MPETNPPIRAHPAKPPRSLGDAAKDGMLVELRCNLCRRGATYLAHDLLPVCGPEHPVHVAPFDCTHCGTAEYVRVRTRIPSKEEYGRLTIRRPVARVWKWRSGLLGE